MLYPAVSELEKATKSRYALVLMIAKRARKLAEDAEEGKIELTEKPVTMAINDIANGKVYIKNPEVVEVTE